MRKLSLFMLMGLSVLLAGGVQAQKKPTDKMGGMQHTAPAAKESYTGMVKGAPTAKSFMLAMRSKTVTVAMGKGARARDKASGKFVGVASLKPGSNVTAVGALSGSTLTASTVTVNSTPGAKPTPKMGKMGKMDKKM